MMDQVKFHAMKDGDAADYAFLTEHEIEHTKGTADRLLQALVMLDEGLSGYQVTRLGHSLQSATRAERDGADTDWIVSALFCDLSCGNNAPGLSRNTVISRCSIMAITWAATETSARPIEDISTSMIALLFANDGTKIALIQSMILCR